MSESEITEQTEAEALEAQSFAPDVDVVTEGGAVENPSDPSNSSTPTSTPAVEDNNTVQDIRQFLGDYYKSHDGDGKLLFTHTFTHEETLDQVVVLLANRVADLERDIDAENEKGAANRSLISAYRAIIGVLTDIAVQVTHLPESEARIVVVDEEEAPALT
jgi:hypothetical protein